ncbi:DUF397 domain-containing protein [Streptomyces sp. GS7]|uniref:DUF397 domain-containing protein n=1 Tax=Streptomyces sp. GS7 TaxID=2692234 RepID=UPI0013181923|nr:DUF397 domain-containing protein [Streptomyces sp. GS7]QHC27331.1 DUF397 domain-containing protein [Streptomyces sp. GS7]
MSVAVWRKSSYSNKEGGDCVEVAEGFLDAADWRKSMYSNQAGGNCIEVAHGHPHVVPVRDSKAPRGPVLVFPAGAWAAFVGVLKG